MLARRKAPRMGVRTERRHFPSHESWVRGFQCSIFGKHECEGRIECCHVRIGTEGGTGIKPHSRWTIPLCSRAHRLQHQMGETSFSAKFGIDMKAIAERLARVSPHRKAWEGA